MALDIGELVRSYNAGTKALLKAAGLPESMYADPAVQQVIAQAAPAAAPAAKKPATRKLSPAEQFVSNAGKYRQSHGGQLGLIEQLATRNQKGPVRVVQNAAGGNPLERVTQTDPRTGEAYQQYRLLDGRLANVHYSDRGRRRVAVFRR